MTPDGKVTTAITITTVTQLFIATAPRGTLTFGDSAQVGRISPSLTTACAEKSRDNPPRKLLASGETNREDVDEYTNCS
jgi:hypothetical protein